MADGYCRITSTSNYQQGLIENCSHCGYSANMYNNGGQYTGQNYQNSYPSYATSAGAANASYNAGYGYDYGQNQYVQNIQQQPIPPGEEYPQNSWAPVAGAAGGSYSNGPTGIPHGGEDEAVAQERKAQNAQLIKQREDYVRKAKVLKRELELLRNQKHEILSENSSQRDMELILKENDKLQEEIQSKLKAIYNVIEMLSSIIKDGCKISDLESQLDESSPKTSDYKLNASSTNNSSMKSDDPAARYNYMHYDPELHWCRLCDEFPKTAKDYLLHLQCDKHKMNMQENDVGDNTPWHKLPPEATLPTYEGAPKKRIPIRGLQFFISAPAWYCKLCDTWIGDLHCASHHLKSQSHFQNYANFVEQNPHWEIEWLKDREKAKIRNDRHHSSDSDDQHEKKKKKKKRNAENSSSKDKKKKKKSKKRRKHSSDSSSSSSSDSSSDEDEGVDDKSKSIRVAMRNMKVQSIMNEDLTGKWEMLERLVDEHKKKETKATVQQQQQPPAPPPVQEEQINQWMTISGPQVGNDKEKVLLDNLKDRMKQKHELERAKHAEQEKRQREKEREERELSERKVKEEQLAKERFERERREREREEYERIRDKDRNQVRFKTSKDHHRRDDTHYRKRRTPSESPERDSRSRYRRDSDGKNGGDSSSRRSRSRSYDRDSNRSNEKSNSNSTNSSKKSTSNKRLPFIGRMPLFKNKKPDDNKVEKEIKKEEYDIPRVTRFQPGNLARAFLPQPDVVCFPKLSSYPPISAPPPPPPPVSQLEAPDPPKISEEKVPKAPPAPKIGVEKKKKVEEKKQVEPQQQQQVEAEQQQQQQMDPNMMSQYYDYSMMQQYAHMYDYSQYQQQVDDGSGLQPPPPPPVDDGSEEQLVDENGVPLSHTMPLQPPPLPPNDPNEDLAMLGIDADDMAAQTF